MAESEIDGTIAYTLLDHFSFTTRAGVSSSSRYIEVYHGENMVSRHTNETEATEAAVNYAKTLPPGNHQLEFRTPNKFVSIKLLQVTAGGQGAQADIEPPLAPVGLSESGIGASGFTGDWADNGEPDIKDYRVYRSSTSATTGFTLIAEVTASTYAFTGLSPGTTYWWRVTARDVFNNESAPSVSRQVTTGTAVYVSPTGSDAAAGTQAAPWQTVAKVNATTLTPGVTVNFQKGGTYSGVLTISNSGTAAQNITVSSYGSSGPDPILRAASLTGNYITVSGIDFDNNKESPSLQDRVIHIRGNNITISGGKVHNGTVDGIDIRGGATNFLIDGVEIYHLLAGSYGSQDDAHGIGVRAGAGNTIAGTVNNTNIHEVSGDSMQVDPDRSANSTITITGSGNTWWTQPLASNFNAGWVAGQSPGENAIDTKMGTNGSITLNFTNTTMYGWEDQVGGIGNRAALNLKETLTATFNRLTVYDCEIAFRCRGNTGNGNPNITIQNAVVYDCLTAVRAEDSVNNLKLYNNTFGDGITTFLQEVAGGIGTGGDLRNNAFLGTKPAAFSDATNISASSADFVDSATDDYRLLEGSSLIDAGATISGVTVDRAGNSRIGAYEVGAYDGFVSTSTHAYFELLIAHPNFVLEKGFSSATPYPGGPSQQIADTWLVPTSGAYDATRWLYDAAEDAAALRWDDNQTSQFPALRWGNTPGYTEPVPTSFGTLGTGTFLFVFDWKIADGWAINQRNTSLPNVLQTHKAYHAKRGDDLTLEIRNRYTGASNQFPGPTGNQVCSIDLRTYIGGGVFGDAVASLATIYPEPEQWYRLFYFLDGGNLEASLWGEIEGQSIVYMVDKATGFSTDMRNIDAFHYQMNSSQSGGSGVSGETHWHTRNWVCLSGLTHAEAEALVQQSSW